VFLFLPLFALSISESHIARQFIWFAAGFAGIVIFSYIISKLLWKSCNLEAIRASKISLILGLILTFIWFTFLFNSFVNLYLIIIIGIIVVATLFITVLKFDES